MGRQEQLKSRILALMAEKELSELAFATEVGINPNVFSDMIKGSRSITKKDVTLISKATGVSTEWLLNGESSKTFDDYIDIDPVEDTKATTAVRLMKYLRAKGIAPTKTEKEIDYGNGSIAKHAKNGTAIGSDKLEKILSLYPDLSAEWLLRGTGEMIVGEGKNPEQLFRALNMPPNSDKIIEVWLQFMECTKGMQELYRQSR